MAAFQTIKIPIGLALVFFLGLGLEGAILTVFVAHLANIIVQLRYVYLRLAVRLDLAYLREWIRQAWIPLYGRIPGVLNTLDIIIYTLIIGSVIGAAYYTAALVVTKMVSRVGHVSQALYPKLLADGSRDHISENFTLVLYFAIPLLVLAVLFSRHAMFLLNPEYASAWAAGALLAIGMFLRVIMHFIRSVLTGTDVVDLEERPSASALLRSRLFLVGTVENYYYAAYLVTLAISLYTFQDLPEDQLVVVWSLVMLIISGPFLLYYTMLSRRYAPFRPSYRITLRHVAGAACMVVIFLATNDALVTFDVNIYSYLPGLLLELAICCATYLGVTYAIDQRTRRLFGLVFSEISSRR